MKHITLGIEMAFQGVEDELWDTSLLALLQGSRYHIYRRAITGLLVK